MQKFSDVEKLKNLVEIASKVSNTEFSEFKKELNGLYLEELEDFLTKNGAAGDFLDKIRQIFKGPEALTDEEIEQNLRPDTKGVQNVRPINRERNDIAPGPDRSDMPFGIDRDNIENQIGPTPTAPTVPPPAPTQQNAPAAPAPGPVPTQNAAPMTPRGPVPLSGPSEAGPSVQGRSLTDRIKAVRTALTDYRDYVRQNADQFDPKYLRSVENLLKTFNTGVQQYENPQAVPDLSEAPTEIIPPAPAPTPEAPAPTAPKPKAPRKAPGGGSKK